MINNIDLKGNIGCNIIDMMNIFWEDYVMSKGKIKYIVFLIIIAVTLLSLVSVSYAWQGKRTVEAWYGDIKIVCNGQQIYYDTEPFIVDGTTYVPLRMMSGIFNKDVSWDATNYTIMIDDKPNSVEGMLRAQIFQQNYYIATLEERIREMERELDEGGELDLEDLEDELNDEFEDYRDIEFEISLSGDEDDISVKIDVDMDEYDDEWDDLSTRNKESYLQDICDEILDEYPRADISGYIRDSSRSSTKKLLEFHTNSRGDVVIGDDDSDLAELEDELNDDYEDYFDDLEILFIELDGDEDDITFTVFIEYDDYEDEWDDLSDREIENFMDDIYDDIEDEFEDADIIGYIYDTDNERNLARFDPDRSTEFRRYVD